MRAQFEVVRVPLREKCIPADHVLDHFEFEWREMMAGEEQLAKLLYLICTSRLLPKPMHAVIKGPSSAGKSEIRRKVVSFFPPESVVSFTAMSDKALLYDPRDYRHAILSMAEASSLSERVFQDYLLREFMSEGRLKYRVVEDTKAWGKVTTEIEKEGPVTFLVTTTMDKLHPENETRMLSLRVCDSEEQTRRVLLKLAEREEGEIGSERIERWQDYQRHLASAVRDRPIIVPYAAVLAGMVSAKSVRIRRDFGQLLTAIKAHALLHYSLRLKDDRGRILANIKDDYAIVRDLMVDVFQGRAPVTGIVHETVEAVRDCGDGVTAQAIAEHLDVDKSTAHRRLQDAVKAGLVTNLETRPNRPGRYCLIQQETPEPLPNWQRLDAAWRSA